LKLSRQYTNHDGKSIDKYLQEISKVELLTSDEEIKLAKQIKKGDREAFERLVNSNLRFVVTVAKQYQSQGLTLGDLINEGNIGVIKAAKRFDETRGFKFISYAVWWIRQAILQALGERGRIVRLPLNRIGILSKIRNLNSEFEQNFGREPSAEEIAELLNVKDFDVSEAIQIAGKNISIDAPLKSTEENNLYSLLANNSDSNPDYMLLENSLKEEIVSSLRALSKREAEILKLYFGLDCDHAFTLEDIGQKFHLTRERVRQIKEKAIRRLRHKKRAERLRKYLG
jgi:RNA polymerase primary sigma factor